MTLARLSLVASLALAACSTDSSDSRGTTTGITGVTTMTAPIGTDTGVASEGPSAPTSTPTTSATDGSATTPDPGSASEAPTSDEPLNTTGLVATSEDPPPSVDLPPPPPEGDYAALVIPGDPTRVSVRKADKDNDTCTTISFVSPAEGGPLEYDISLPATWFVQGALIHQGAADCLTFEGFPEEPIMAYSGNGTATWTGTCPATINIDVTLAFQQDLPWVPVEVLLQEPAVPATGC